MGAGVELAGRDGVGDDDLMQAGKISTSRQKVGYLVCNRLAPYVCTPTTGLIPPA